MRKMRSFSKFSGLACIILCALLTRMYADSEKNRQAPRVVCRKHL